MDRKTIQLLIEQHVYSEAMQDILRMFAAEETSMLAFKASLAQRGKTFEDIHEEALTVIIDMVNEILDDHIISRQEMATLRRLKLVLHIQEGDFIAAHKEEDIANILGRELELIYTDKVVDKEESAKKVDLQELLGLSYDQYLQFEQEAVEQALKRGADISKLDTFYVL